MGGSYFHKSDYDDRVKTRALHSTPVMAYTHDIKTGRTKAAVHKDLDPKGVKMRESRDSDAHPVTVPIAILLDVTGSMQHVPEIIEAALPKLMGHFLEDKASGKKYLGDGYPAILIGAVDDYDAMRGDGCLQIGQFESGMEIDQMIEKIWLTGNGGGTYEESYQLGVYFLARHSVHDHWEKRGKKGYLFIIGDEHAYLKVKKTEVADIIGDDLQADIPLKDILAEAQERYHVFFIIPNMTSHYSDPKLLKDWQALLPQQNVLKLEDPSKICELIASAVAICEEYVGLDDLVNDGVAEAIDGALVPLSKDKDGGLAKYSAAGLPSVPGTAGGTERL